MGFLFCQYGYDVQLMECFRLLTCEVILHVWNQISKFSLSLSAAACTGCFVCAFTFFPFKFLISEIIITLWIVISQPVFRSLQTDMTSELCSVNVCLHEIIKWCTYVVWIIRISIKDKFSEFKVWPLFIALLATAHTAEWWIWCVFVSQKWTILFFSAWNGHFMTHFQNLQYITFQ